eukprot:TRINITY_DN101777_c0_g1_i1.p1 TRINITY_DN101777_c0_g1~~TRINITY_DN101777_c0_g1_i1.p1  ORF type:complete len:151 (-),score=48.04 TRINITY_DN101777_c0_g1_i1:122-574(-)
MPEEDDAAKPSYDVPLIRLPDSKCQLDTDDLDEEERKVLAEVKKKGYYHARPANAEAPPPQRIDTPAAEAAPAKKPIKWNTSTKQAAAESETRKRSTFDEYQKKWDRFDKEEPVVREVVTSSTKKAVEPVGPIGQLKTAVYRCCGRRKGK